VALGLAATAIQAVPFTYWATRRTHLVASAEGLVAEVPLAGTVCGLEAPNLLLARPMNGPALSSNHIWSPDCRLDGRLADYVVVPDGAECTAYESPFVRDNHATLVRRPRVVTVALPPWRGTGSRSCLYSVVDLREGIIPPR
jgi:hypothetical protein